MISIESKTVIIARINKIMNNGIVAQANMIRIMSKSNKYNSNTLAKEICNRSSEECNEDTVRSQLSRWKSGKQMMSLKYALIIESIFMDCMEEFFYDVDFNNLDNKIKLMR